MKRWRRIASCGNAELWLYIGFSSIELPSSAPNSAQGESRTRGEITDRAGQQAVPL
jgi:hypothetical protein